jgi:phenylalanyl-tRNA synthetase beta chain
MQFPESWLRSFVNPPVTTHELAHQLTMAGLEVEEVQPVAAPFTGVVVARIESIEPHPNADKLRVCQVNAGDGQHLQIVCGAPNAAAGMMVPLATVGAELPGGLKIAVAKMRGVQSSGMLCSSRELGLSDEHEGLMALSDDAVLGSSIRDALGLDESVFILKLTPNRADCLSIKGVAREVAALNDCPWQEPAYEPVPVTIADSVAVDIQAPDLCGRFAGRVVRGVNARAKTPDWMVKRLERSGQRSVSALVDISNYLMLERGRPTHVFDLDKLSKPALTVRWARAKESVKLLNGDTVSLEPTMGVIAANDRIESLAGIMGGDETAVSLETENVYLEAAFWWPEAIAGRTRQLKINSEAAHRFERGVDFENIADDLERLTRLVVDICGGQAGPIDDVILQTPRRDPVQMRLTRCQKVLGIACADADISSVFDRLGFTWTVNGDVYQVTPPSYRFDIRIEEDLIEEVARMIGFDNIPARPPMARAKMHVQPESLRDAHRVRRQVADRDYQEVINFSFVDRSWEVDRLGHADPIGLVNPIASQMSVMRSSLMPGLLANVVYNANRKQSRIRVFELGRVFARDSQIEAGGLTLAGIDQPLTVAGAAWGPIDHEQWGQKTRLVDFYDVKRDIEALFGPRASKLRFAPVEHPFFHPGRCASISMQGKVLGLLGELHPKWVREEGLLHAPIMFELQLAPLLAQPLPKPVTLSRQPMVQRDIALWVSAHIPAQAILDTIHELIEQTPELSMVREVTLFDVWRDEKGDGDELSLAFRFSLQDPEITLEDEKVEQCLAMIRQRLASVHHVRQR